MAPTANRPAPSQPASRPKNVRVPVVPVIPLPIAQKQQQARQLKQQKQDELDKENKAKEEKKAREIQEAKEAEEAAAAQKEKEAREAKEAEEKKAREAKEAEEKAAREAKEAKEKAELELKKLQDNQNTTSDMPSSPAATDSTPRTAHDTATTSPETKNASSTASAAPGPLEVTGRQTPQVGHDVYGAHPSHLHAPLSAGLATNGNVVPAEFVFPVQPRSGSAARHRGPSGRHLANAAPPGYPQNHQNHPSNNSITFGYPASNNPSPAPVAHGPLPPPPGLMTGPPYVPFNAPNMGPGDWAGPPGADLNGFTPTTAGFNSSNPGSYRGSHSPDHAIDGVAYGHPHQSGPFQLPGGPNGSMPPRTDSMPAVMSPHFFHPGYPGNGPAERHGGPGGAPGGSPVRVVDFQLVQHLQQQIHHSFDSPQTADTHILLHFPNDPSQASNQVNQAGQANEQTKMFPGHRAVLSQSYTIAQFLRNDPGTMHPGPYNNHPVFSYHLKIEDPYLTSEAAMQALHSLYGMPIESLPFADQPISAAMDKALANLSAGFLFMLENVKAVAAEQVSQLISWETVERVFAFCLNGAAFPNLPDNPHPDPYELPFLRADFRYGDSTSPIIRRLLHNAINFVIRNFPHNAQLVLGGTVETALPRFSRFPVEVPHKSKAHAHKFTAAGADAAHSRSNGSVSMPFRSSVGVKSPQLKFGDFAPRDDALQSSSYPSSTPMAALSQILVSLPFAYLKYIMEHPALGMAAANIDSNGNGSYSEELSTDHRRAILGYVIAERERRRYDALNSIRAGLVIDIAEQRDAVLSRVQSAAPPQHRDHPFAVDAWDSMGYKEYSYGDELKLGRVWAQSETSR